MGSLAFLAEAAAIALIPYLGSTLAAAAALVAFGLLNGFGNVVTITAFQRWAPPGVMGRLAGLLMLASLGVFPLSVALAAFVVHGFGPALFFPLAAATLAAALLAGLSQRTWRNFGAITPPLLVGRWPAGHRVNLCRFGGARIMNLHMTDALVDQRIRDIHSLAAPARPAGKAGARTAGRGCAAGSASRWSKPGCTCS